MHFLQERMNDSFSLEIPAHQAGFHSFSCNLAANSVLLPFHIRYQPAGPHSSSEILIPSPEVNFIQPNGEIETEYGDPFYLTIPVANTKHLFLVNFSTLFAAVFGALYLAREILRKWNFFSAIFRIQKLRNCNKNDLRTGKLHLTSYLFEIISKAKAACGFL